MFKWKFYPESNLWITWFCSVCDFKTCRNITGVKCVSNRDMHFKFDLMIYLPSHRFKCLDLQNNEINIRAK